MKGKISIGDFIHQVKNELIEAQNRPGESFYELHDVELAITFALKAEGKGSMNLFVVELGGQVEASQTHKVTLKLKPIKKPQENDSGSESSGGKIGRPQYFGKGGPVYEPHKG